MTARLYRLLAAIFAAGLVLVSLSQMMGQQRPPTAFTYTVDTRIQSSPAIYFADAITGTRIELTQSTGDDPLYGRSTVWSADGAYIAMTTFRYRSEPAVYRLNLDQMDFINITASNTLQTLPIIRRDGSLLYNRLNTDANGNIRQDIFLWSDDNQTETWLENVQGRISLSPDGRSLIFLDRIILEGDAEIDSGDGSSFGNDLYVYDIETQHIDILTDETPYYGSAIWSADSEQIAFIPHRNNTRIVVIDVTTNAIEIIEKEHIISHLSWSPDGRYFAVSGRLHGDNHIYLYDRDEQTWLDLTPDFNFADEPDFSPDGRYLIFSEYDNGDNDLYLYDVPRERLQALYTSSDNESNPQWRPRP